MRYVLPIAPNVCSYTTLAKMNCQLSTCLATATGFISTKPFLVLDPDAARLPECPRRTIRALARTVMFKLTSFVSVSGILLLQLSEFHVNRVNDCLYCISCVVCYKAEELRRSLRTIPTYEFLHFITNV